MCMEISFSSYLHNIDMVQLGPSIRLKLFQVVYKYIYFFILGDLKSTFVIRS